MDKTAARSFFKSKRKALTKLQIEDLSLQIANRIVKLPIWEKEFYHLFLPIEKQKEVNTEFIMHVLQGKDKHIVISKSNFVDFTMQHFLLTDTTQIEVNKFGIPEPKNGIEIKPEQLDVIFIPLLASDSKGNRVGYGKGFYDRFLHRCKPSVLKIGLSFFEPIDHKIEGFTENDMQLNYLVTPKDTFQF
ncbi:5-formyltetrahydrofolate cyclo-ligase [Psychroflexus salis]|uniref:5-formyltetrahydrofolate cyclo-ligase n=1 Tax=Psychroflexus salis TaxID=1526574 RepID=A0A916ZQ46_9FLAO|nr:5-formyltetrahydrofolate cyclo-ligase [Psychroflexus salis]GGE08574.1 5-formyltetrahydrofolate cyclo-ligase [Psychroflexus salis]